ncbi:MAG: fibrobacter succinogenes major paralogous domain-containing protein [Bacteroidales bacterium]|nr:fibrobacter succinogenes major paralogous domain-containing protein [Bacteroidales bacterium]
MKRITLILVIIATFVTKSFAYCPIPQWCPKADLHQTLCPGDTIDPIEFPSVIGKTLVITWWTNETRVNFMLNPPPGITVSGDASTPLGDREYAWPVSIKGTPTATGTHHYTVSNTCGVELLHGSITVVGLTIGTVTPTGDRYIVVGTAFTPLTLTAEPAGIPPITIQWFSNTTASTTGGTNLGSANGAQTDTFTPPSATVNAPNGIYYYAVATNSCGNIATNVSGKHVIGPACNSYVGATGVASCTGTTGVAPGTVYWGGSTNINANARTISGNGITQVWSGAVTTTGCDKTGFTAGNVNADCRNSTNGSWVHYFNWCYVMRHATTLCPSPWRVPTCQDFVNLDVAMGGTGIGRSLANNATSNGWTGTNSTEKYTGTATGTWGGARWTQHATDFTTSLASSYWSSSESSATHAFRIAYSQSAIVYDNITKNITGYALRCVR